MQSVMEKAREVVGKIGELPPIPSVILKSMSMLNDPSVTVKKIQMQILMDQSLTAFILKVANSALYGLRKEVSTVSYAINLMGYNTTKSILMSYLTKNLYSSKGSKFIQGVLWKHSLATAIFARKIGEIIKKANIEEIFISSLLHDIGKGVLFKNKTLEFEDVVEKHINEELDFLDIEREKWGFSHIEVGYLLMKNWRFSDNIVEPLIYHHNQKEYSGDNIMVPIISLANKLSHLNGFSFREGQYELEELAVLKISADKMEEIVEKSTFEINNYLEIVG
jgi:HD-like signal output (HDOD) protein